MVTKGNLGDSKLLRYKLFISKLYGKLFGDKVYIPKELFTGLFSNGAYPITKFGKNMRAKLDALLTRCISLMERASIEMIFDQLKNICQVGYSRHQSSPNYFNNILAALIATTLRNEPYLTNSSLDAEQLLFS